MFRGGRSPGDSAGALPDVWVDCVEVSSGTFGHVPPGRLPPARKIGIRVGLADQPGKFRQRIAILAITLPRRAAVDIAIRE